MPQKRGQPRAPCRRARGLPAHAAASLPRGKEHGEQNPQSEQRLGRKATLELTWPPSSQPSRSQPQPRLPAPLSPHRARRSPRPTCGDGTRARAANLRKPLGAWREQPRSRRGTRSSAPGPPLSAPGPAGAGGGRGPGGPAPPAGAVAPAPASLPSDSGRNFSAAGKKPGGWGCPGRAGPRFTPAPPPDDGSVEQNGPGAAGGRAGPPAEPPG